MTGALAGAGAGASNTIDNTIAAYIENASGGTRKVAAVTGGITLSADDESRIIADAGGYAIAVAANFTSGHSGAGSVGASVATNEIGKNGGHSVTATITNSIIEAGVGGVTVRADSTANIDTLAVGGAGAGSGSTTANAFALGIGGASTDNAIDLDVEASIKTGSTVETTNAGDVTVHAADRSRIFSESVGAALGLAVAPGGQLAPVRSALRLRKTISTPMFRHLLKALVRPTSSHL